MRNGRLGRLGALGLIVYDSTVRRWMLDWGSTPAERSMPLPGDEVVEGVMYHRTRAVTIDATPEAVWPWLIHMGDYRAGWYSYDWLENWGYREDLCLDDAVALQDLLGTITPIDPRSP